MKKLNFKILHTLLTFCETERTVQEMKNRMSFEADAKEVHSIICFMMKKKLILQQPNFSKGGRAQPNLWLTNISLTQYAVQQKGKVHG